MAIIEVENVTKEYQLGQLKDLKQSLLAAAGRILGKEIERPAPFKALDNVSFSIEEGDVVGIIGANGAGKSTLLKLLARITTPTSGNVNVRGRVAPLIEVGAGLIGDLTGRENIFLNAAILGMSQKEIKKKFDEIVHFSELEKFIDSPVKKYSSGMAVRLGFSIATSVESDILIIDEVLAVGDVAFQRKCIDRMEEYLRRGDKTVIFVSHNMRQTERLCRKGLLLNSGKVAAFTDIEEISNRYFEMTDDKIKRNTTKTGNIRVGNEPDATLKITSIRMLNKDGKKVDLIGFKQEICVELDIAVNKPVVKPVIGLGVHTLDMLYLGVNVSDASLSEEILLPGNHKFYCLIPSFPFLPGVYSLRLSVSGGQVSTTMFYGENLYTFQVVSDEIRRSVLTGEGFIDLEAKWSWE